MELVDKLISSTVEGDPARFDLFRLRQQIQEHELTLWPRPAPPSKKWMKSSRK